mgnify:FL=1|jgi:hypothetical protein
MKTITISETELWDEINECFINVKETVLHLEHSLVSISKWEEEWHKEFISDKPKTWEETIDYVRCMTLDLDIDENVYKALTKANISEIQNYINKPMTATRIKNSKNRRRSAEAITSELIYYWMISLGVPFECEKWNLNRLITLIQVCSIKATPSKPMKKTDIMRQNSMINDARRKKFNTKG